MTPASFSQPAIVSSCSGLELRAGREWSLVPDDSVGLAGRWCLQLPGPPTTPQRQTRAAEQASASDLDGQSESAPPSSPRGHEWQVGAGYGWSIDLLQSEGGRRYIPWTVSWGRDLMEDAGPGFLRGRLMWAVEAMPLYWQYRPTDTAGAGILPLVWRWRFVPRVRAAAFAELAFGGVFTGDPVPEGTESANFLTHGAFGIKWRPDRRTALITAYRFQHISNGNQLTTNPGVNAHVLWIGLSVAR